MVENMNIVQSFFHSVFSSHIFVNELSVDWPALCFDDDQDIDHLEPIDVSNEGTGILEDIQRTLTTGVQESKISQV